MKSKNSSILILITLGILLLGTVPYFLTFNNSRLSLNPEDWNAFGSYISGILSVINLFIFIFITFYLSKLDEKRSIRDKDLQKKIVITQFRQSELQQLDKKLDDVINGNGTEDKIFVLQSISSTSLILTNFINQKAYLFPLLDEPQIKNRALNLLEKLAQFQEIISESYGLKIDSSLEDAFATKLQTYIFMKNDFIENLQKFTIADLN